MFVSAVLGPRHSSGGLAVLLTSELFGNGVRHRGSCVAGGRVTVGAESSGWRLLIAAALERQSRALPGVSRKAPRGFRSLRAWQQRADERFETTGWPEVDALVGDSHLQGVVALNFVWSRHPGLVALAKDRDVMRRKRHDDLISVSDADTIEEAKSAVPIPYEKHRRVADQELLVSRTKNLEVEGLESASEPLETVLKANAEQRAAGDEGVALAHVRVKCPFQPVRI